MDEFLIREASKLLNAELRRLEKEEEFILNERAKGNQRRYKISSINIEALKKLQSKIEKLILKNIPKIKKRGWVFSLIWKVFKISKVKDVSEIWTIYRSLKSNNFEIPKTINISHKIELKPNNFQKTYFQKVSEISRFA